MTGAAANRIWCHTCGEYIRPGTHGIHVSCYGRGAQSPPSQDGEIGDAQAVALVTGCIAAVAAAAILVTWIVMTLT